MNKNQPAFPQTTEWTEKAKPEMKGLTKRELIAAIIVAGYCANPKVAETGITPKEKSEAAIIQTDELLKQLEKS